jgi:hypothetical protein
MKDKAASCVPMLDETVYVIFILAVTSFIILSEKPLTLKWLFVLNRSLQVQ